MNLVIQTLREHFVNNNVPEGKLSLYEKRRQTRFVFPSQIAADLWAQKTCTLGLTRSVAKNRFLAWDRFKEELVEERELGKSPVTQVIRMLFAEALLRKNAENPFFESLIPPEYARSGGIFVSFITKLLPSLFMWEKLMKKNGNELWDEEDLDYGFVKKEYTAFLERYKLFEPSWEEREITNDNNCYTIFFPELIEDFAEYADMLSTPQFKIVNAEMSLNTAPLLQYQSGREEIRCAVAELQRLHEEEAIPYEEMAVSVPGLEEIEPWLLLELIRRHIPVTRRAGKKLGETGAGRLFQLINECAASGFSFNSLKALILNNHIPWKEKEENSSLINFGIKNNCVSPYTHDGRTVDIWEEAFKMARSDIGRNEIHQCEGARSLQFYYRDLKKSITALTDSGNFSTLLKNYFVFRSSFLDMEKISKEDDAVLSRCIVELGSLIELEEKFNEASLTPASPVKFFISRLNEIEYVQANQKPGVNIFKWRVAAASPFSCHFVLNASQNAAPVIYQPLKFLRQDKRKRLGLSDNDASGAFFLLCNTGKYTRISASAQTFSGWSIPHSFFAQNNILADSSAENNNFSALTGDPYYQERRFWRELASETEQINSGKRNTGLGRIFPLQKYSFELWKDVLTLNKNNFSFLSSAAPAANPVSKLLKNTILGNDTYLTVTPTRDLNGFYHCPQFWLYMRVFGAEEFSLEAALLDDSSLGLLYHKILENLFAKIKKDDGIFDSRRLDTYKHWTLEIIRDIIKKEPAFRGPLAIPLVSPQAAGISKKIIKILELEAKFFDLYKIAELELPVSLKTGELVIKGVIDRISLSPDAEPVIIDYKTSYLPEQTSAEELPKEALSEFQMPLYIKLYEEMAGVQVKGACFYSINGRKIKTVMGENTGGRNKIPDRENYSPFMEALGMQIEEFAQRVKQLDFVPRKIRFRDCIDCVYKTVCRSVYL